MRIPILTILLINSVVASGQVATNTCERNLTNLYNQAFMRYINELQEPTKLTFDTLFVDKENLPTDSLMTSFNNTKLLILNDNQVLERSKQGFVLIKIFPVEHIKSNFIVSFVSFVVSYDEKTKEVVYENPGSTWIVFNFRKGKYLFKSIQNNGI
jgi:hypothetical protein